VVPEAVPFSASIASRYPKQPKPTINSHKQSSASAQPSPLFLILAARFPHPLLAPHHRHAGPKDNRNAMKSTIVFAAGVVGVVAASPSPDPQMTFAAHAQLGNPKRQADPALLGYMSTDGASSCKSSSHSTQPPHTASASNSTKWQLTKIPQLTPRNPPPTSSLR
jgi:hypothetical protein